MSTNRKKTGGWIRRTSERGANGRGICRWCGAEVPKRRRTFCDDFCVHEWRLRTDPGYLREKVRSRDRGICAICGLNTIEFYRRLQRLPRKRRAKLRRRLDIHPSRRSFWDADHIRPVVEGGGECDLSNIRTLCLWCHRDETEKLRRRRQSTDKQNLGVTQRHTEAFLTSQFKSPFGRGDGGALQPPASPLPRDRGPDKDEEPGEEVRIRNRVAHQYIE